MFKEAATRRTYIDFLTSPLLSGQVKSKKAHKNANFFYPKKPEEQAMKLRNSSRRLNKVTLRCSVGSCHHYCIVVGDFFASLSAAFPTPNGDMIPPSYPPNRNSHHF